jgi:hypothetical protein
MQRVLPLVRGSVVSVPTEECVFESRERQEFSFPITSRSFLGSTQPRTKLVSGALSPGIKGHGCEANRSPPTCAEDKKTCLYIHSPLRLHCLVLNYLSSGITLFVYVLCSAE